MDILGLAAPIQPEPLSTEDPSQPNLQIDFGFARYRTGQLAQEKCSTPAQSTARLGTRIASLLSTHKLPQSLPIATAAVELLIPYFSGDLHLSPL